MQGTLSGAAQRSASNADFTRDLPTQTLGRNLGDTWQDIANLLPEDEAVEGKAEHN